MICATKKVGRIIKQFMYNYHQSLPKSNQLQIYQIDAKLHMK